jgi:hypothetical protein
MIAFYIMDLSTKTTRNALFVDSINPIVEKTTVMMRTAIKTEEKMSLKGVLLLSYHSCLKRWFANKESELLR